MAILFISDLHIGDRKSGVDDVIPFLHLQDDIDQIILLGDIFDCWVTSFVNEIHVYQLKKLLVYISSIYKDYRWILGNHDNDLEVLSTWTNGRLEIGFVPDEPVDYLAFHGHEFDETDYWFLRLWDGVGAKFLNWINVFFKIDWRILITSLSQKAERVRINKIKKVYKLAEEFAKEQEVQYLIIGHTHNPSFIEMDSGIYILDCGDWREHRTAIKVTDDKFQLLSYSKEDQDIEILQEVDRCVQ